jgi:Tol biopolymer transport system component
MQSPTLVLSFVMLLAAQQPPARPAAPAAPPSTDIWLARLTASGIEQPINITDRPGYDNQPSFTPDGTGILFTRSVPSASPSAQAQTDVYFYDFTSRSSAATLVTNTSESEYSPTITPDGEGISVIRVEPGPATLPGQQGIQRLWRFTRDGKNPTLILRDVQPVGYHAWGPDGLLALYVLGKPNTLQVADTRTGRARAVAQNIGRSLHRIPGRDTISVLHIEGDVRTIKELDLKARTLRPIVKAIASSEGDYAWTPDGAILMSNGNELMRWTGGEWERFADLAAHGLTGASRLAVSPDGRWLALVIPEAQK